MRKILSILFLCFAANAFAASEYITATMTITNSTLTNSVYYLNGNERLGSSNRTATTWVTNASPMYTATNIFSQLGTWPVSGVIVSNLNTNVLTFKGFGLTLVASNLTGASYSNFCELTFTTNTIATNTYALIVPPTALPASARASNGSYVVSYVNFATNAVDTNAAALTNYISIGPQAQEASNKIWNASRFVNGSVSNSILTNIGRANITNLASTNIYAHSNYTAMMTVGGGASITNLSSPGSGLASEKLGAGSVASGDLSIAFGNSATATNENSLAIGVATLVGGRNAIGIGYNAVVPTEGTNGVAIGVEAAVSSVGGIAIGESAVVAANHTNSVAIGAGSVTTGTNQIVLGGSSHHVTVAGEFRGVRLTNVVTRGTNVINARVDFTSRANTSLVDGYNTAIVLGSNVYVKLSGPSGAYTNTGFAAELDGSFHIVEFDNPANNFTILDNTTANGEVAANRIRTTTGGLLNFTNNPVILPFIYNATDSKWKLMNGAPYR